MELVLVRHARPVRLETEEGPADPDLTEVGHRQAGAVADWLAGDGPLAATYASPLRRAVQTAAPVAAALGHQPRIDDRFAEWDRDASAYIPMEELREEHDELLEHLFSGRLDRLGIDVVGFRRRVLAGFADVAAAHPGERAVVVCHGGVINCYLADVLGLDRLLFFEPGYTSVSRVLVARTGERTLVSVNETAHLRDVT